MRATFSALAWLMFMSAPLLSQEAKDSPFYPPSMTISPTPRVIRVPPQIEPLPNPCLPRLGVQGTGAPCVGGIRPEERS
jgi:hypothetical protein